MYKIIPILFIAIHLLGACKNKNTKHLPSENTTESKKENTTPITVSYAKCFLIKKENGVTKIIIKNPDDGYKTQQEIVLLPKGVNYNKNNEEEILISVPVQKIIPFSASYLAMLDTLGVQHSIVGIDNPNYIFNTKVLEGVENKKIAVVGGLNQLNIEKVISLSPNVIMNGNVFGDANNNLAKLNKIGIPAIFNYDWKEAHPLGRAEWIKVFGALYQKEKEANSIFSDIEKKYKKEKTQATEEKPTVLFGALYNGVWYIPGGGSYVAQLVKDAKGDYPWISTKESGSLSLSFESVFAKYNKVDVWLNPNFNTITALLENDERYAHFVKLSKQNIFNNNKRVTPMGGNDYYERGTLRPDLILRDYNIIFSHDTANYNATTFFTKIKNE